MKSSNHFQQYRCKRKGFIFSILILAFCSYNGKANAVDVHTAIKTVADTVPANEMQKIQWDNVGRFVAENGVLKTILPGGKEGIIRRKDYQEFASKTQIPDYDKTFTRVEIEPEYPGGPEAWNAYVKKNLHYPADALKQQISGTVIVSFIVQHDGSLTDVEVVAGPTNGGLREEALRLVKMSGNWNAAIQNFHLVRAYRKQPVIFQRPTTDW